jgi:hypothetical protein
MQTSKSTDNNGDVHTRIETKPFISEYKDDVIVRKYVN